MIEEALIPEIFDYILIMTRMAALVIMFPALGDQAIPGRIRASMGAAIALVAYFPLKDHMPDMPVTTWGIFWLIFKEFLIGMMLGTIVRFLLTAAHVAGTISSFMTGLAAAQSFDPNQGGQSAIVSAFVSVSAIVLIFVTNVHHMMIEGLINSYVKLPAGSALPIEDFASVAVEYVVKSFALGVQMASPFLLYGIIFNTCLGLISRLSPGFQVFFIGMPLNIYMGFLLFSILYGSMLMFLMRHVTEYLADLMSL